VKEISDEEVILNELNSQNNLHELCLCYDLSENIIDMFAEKVDWDDLCKYQNITNYSNELFKKHADKINWMNICRNKNITEQFIENHIGQT
jgi:hypothetical protein